MDDFFTRALVAGIGLAVTTGPLGCLVVWRRMAYFGATMAHSALLGVALAFAVDINPMLGVFAVAATVSVALLVLQRSGVLSSDTLMGILAHAALALGLVAITAMSWLRVDLMGLLFGDILAVSVRDIGVLYGGGALVLGVLAWLWRSLLASTVSDELAQAEGLNPERARIAFMLLMAVVIAIAMKIVGILLITALLIIPAATARRLASGPEAMALMASGLGAGAVALGLSGSLAWDTPSGPSIVLAAFALFLLSLIPGRVRRPARSETPP
nr:metal ABC transporter permease [Roseospira marina]